MLVPAAHSAASSQSLRNPSSGVARVPLLLTPSLQSPRAVVQKATCASALCAVCLGFLPPLLVHLAHAHPWSPIGPLAAKGSASLCTVWRPTSSAVLPPPHLLCSRPHIFCCAPACGLQYSPVFSHLHPLPECELFQGRGCALLSCLRCLAGCSARRTMPVLWEGTSGSTVWSCCGWRVASLLTQSSGEWESRFAVWGLTAVARHPVIAASCSPGAWLQLCSLHQVRLVQVEPQHLSTCYVPGAGLNAFRVAHWILTATLRSVLL